MMRTHLGQAVQDVMNALGDLTRAVGNLVAATLGHSHLPFHLARGAHYMYVVKDTQPDVAFVAAFKVVDAEGHEVADPAGLTVETVSSDPNVVGIIPDAGGDAKKGAVHFGDPGLASVNTTVKLADGTLIGSFGAQFTVTVGDPAAIAAGTIAFEGLTEVPETPNPTDPVPVPVEPA
jgi:hypothetical protein